MARDRDDYDDVDDRPARPAGGAGPLDSFFLNTPLWVIATVVLFFCCALVNIVLGLVGLLTARSPTAKRNASVMLAVGVVAVVLNIALYATGLIALPMAGPQPAPVPVPAPQ